MTNEERAREAAHKCYTEDFCIKYVWDKVAKIETPELDWEKLIPYILTALNDATGEKDTRIKELEELKEYAQSLINDQITLIENLKKALKPFAALLKKHHRDMPDERPIFAIEDSIVTAGDFRRAANEVGEDSK